MSICGTFHTTFGCEIHRQRGRPGNPVNLGIIPHICVIQAMSPWPGKQVQDSVQGLAMIIWMKTGRPELLESMFRQRTRRRSSGDSIAIITAVRTLWQPTT